LFKNRFKTDFGKKSWKIGAKIYEKLRVAIFEISAGG
jgi:hypothetical protein